jgi:hypothetical protein
MCKFISATNNAYFQVEKKFIKKKKSLPTLPSEFWDVTINKYNRCRRRCRPKSYRENFWTFSILVIAKLNLCETVLKQKNAKHNSRENKLVYSIMNRRSFIENSAPDLYLLRIVYHHFFVFFITRVVFCNILLIVRLTYLIDFVNTFY